jgi:hypothetical protein
MSSLHETKMSNRIRNFQFYIQGSNGSGHMIRVVLQAPDIFAATEMAKAMYGNKILSGPLGLD